MAVAVASGFLGLLQHYNGNVEFDEYRPYRAMAQFERETGKYVDDGEVARMARYVEIREGS
jgi:hypothetical protein